MVVPIQVRVDARGALKTLNKLGYFVRVDIPRLTFSAAVDGRDYAARIAPLDTGALIQALGTAQTERGKGAVGWSVVSKTPPNIRNNNPRGFPYHAVLEYGKPVRIRKSGRVQRYMLATSEWLKKRYPELIKHALGKVK